MKEDLDANSGEQPDRDSSLDARLNRQIGAYRIVREIGRGGMGAVYEGERTDNAFQQRVAIKFVKRGMDTDSILKRFRHERQILASLNHPNIARLLDGGTTDDGLPYFVMEFIAGEALYRYCDHGKLSIRERLRLFQQVCEAVAEAHRNKVVHRDLKPSNILVKPDGMAKLLDFGIAKLLDPELAAATVEPTATQMRLMTPEYASPEQICGEPVTPAADIYALGVLLYELITGHRPYLFKNRAPHEISRVVCEQEPLAPSESLTREDNLVPTAETGDNKPNVAEIVAARNADLETLRRALAGDLDRVILKALRKNPAERYQTALELSADIERVLENRAVRAEPIVVAKKAAAQTKLEKKSIAILPFTHLGALGANGETGEQFLGVGLADSIVLRLSGVQQITVRPTSSVIQYENTEENPLKIGADLMVEHVVTGTIRRAGNRLRVSAQLLNVETRATAWAQTFDELMTDILELEDTISDKVAKSLAPHLTGAEQQKLKKRGTESPEAYEAYLRGRFHWNQFTPESLPKALASFQKAVALDPEYALAHVGLADFYTWAGIHGIIPTASAVDAAEAAARRAIELDKRLGGAYAALGLVMQNRRHWAEAERLQRQAIKLSPQYVSAHEWQASLLIGQGRTAEGIAEIKITETLDPLGLRTKALMAWNFYQAHQFDEALARGKQIIDLDKNYPQGQLQTAVALWAMGRVEEALPYFQRFDEMTPGSALAKYQLCCGLAAANRRAEARAVLAEIKQLAATTHVKPYFLGMAHAALDERDQAFAYFEQSFAEFEAWLLWFGTEPMLESLRDDERYVNLLERLDNQLADKYRAKMRQKARTGEYSASEKSIAVLPLKFIGATKPDDAFLGVGLADAMITRLSKVNRLVVRPTSSVLQLDLNEDALTVGRKLAVDFILDGTIRRAGERVRISAQLLDVAANATRWAESFDERLSGVLELEDLVAERVARLVIPKLTGEEKRRLARRDTHHAGAFEAYLRGRYHLSLFTPHEFARAKDYFEQAIRLDPDYALAYVALAQYYFVLGTFAAVPPLECYEKVRDMAERALALDDTLGEAHAILGFTYYADLDFENVEKTLRRAIELSPNYSLGYMWMSVILTFFGRCDEAVAAAKHAVELNPLSAFDRQHHAWILYHVRRFDEAVEYARSAVKEEPSFSHALGVLSWILRHVGETKESLVYARRAVEYSGANPWLVSNLAATLAKAGQTGEAREILNQLENTAASHFVSPFCLAIAGCNLGETEKVFEHLENAFATRDVWLIWIASDPQLDLVRDDARFINLLNRINNSAN